MKRTLTKNLIAILVGIIIFIIFYNFNITSITSDIFDILKLDMIERRTNEQIKKEKLCNIKNENDLYGLWKDDSFGFNERYEALIDNNSITVYKYVNNEKYIYWIGSFNLTDNISLQNLQNNNLSHLDSIITSENHKELSKYIASASQSDTKIFTFKNNTIKFISQFNDDYYEVSLKKYNAYNERLRPIKYSKDRKNYYNEETNKELILDNYVIKYPSYFDTKEENSFEDIKDFFVYNINPNIIEKKSIILSPSNTSSHAEFYVSENENKTIKDIYELYEEMYLNSENLNSDTSELISFEYNVNSNSIMIIFSTKYVDRYNNNKVTYGIAFENWILKNDTNELLIVGVGYDYNDTSDYDYISDYEKIIEEIKKI